MERSSSERKRDRKHFSKQKGPSSFSFSLLESGFHGTQFFAEIFLYEKEKEIVVVFGYFVHVE